MLMQVSFVGQSNAEMQLREIGESSKELRAQTLSFTEEHGQFTYSNPRKSHWSQIQDKSRIIIAAGKESKNHDPKLMHRQPG